MHRCFWPRIFLSSCALAATLSSARADDAPIASGLRPDGKVRADILSLKRTEGDTVTLRFALVNDSNQSVTVTVGNIRLIDLIGRMSYEPGVSSNGCSADPGSRTICWAVFAAPSSNTKTINVKFYDAFDLISTPISN